MASKQLTGKIAPERIRACEAPRPPEGLVEAFLALGDCSGIVSDVMDELGITGVIAASTLRPTIPGAVVVGPAFTVRNVIQRTNPYKAARDKVNGMAEFEAHNLATPGDVIVIQGVAGVSNMGGISSQTGKRQGEAGAIVSGGIRDVPHSRAVGYPIWSTEVTPVTGKWRLQTVELNGDVEIESVRVSPGDIRHRRRHRRLLRPPRPRPRGPRTRPPQIRRRSRQMRRHRRRRPRRGTPTQLVSEQENAFERKL